MFSCMGIRAVLPLVGVLVVSSVHASDEGRLSLRGAVLESACAISTLTRDQVIEVKSLFTREWLGGGRSEVNPISLRLDHCTLSYPGKALPASRFFRIAFDGRSSQGLFAVEGQARGLALQVGDGHGKVFLPGVLLPMTERIPEDRVLNYSMRLVADSEAVVFGDYHSTLRFKMDYF